MDVADEAVLFHELFVGRRSVSGVGLDRARRVGLVENSLAQMAALVGGGVRRTPRQAIVDQALGALKAEKIRKGADSTLIAMSAVC
jgi:hypothetical protein